ncbi:RsmE family RNA methyltransferase [Candidatus Methylacidithermus pantelleriae]|uniref:Ribosomal RNA small subunit methyltransferase E n=1 Tax=Candidatus Methylacidithermus pantelleriae TaxID=2744239 RepID=A0A8J2FTZ1_9BACT|nr:RsmE family RNA methyltransferase [Candidatus Methylacidithermus pantelleriae]CAF0705287.1 Ribosomal RNA small subunit methyltransferase E [Candidatus Methylacidithermus pantelleriae]
MHRYFCPQPESGLLSPGESHHCQRVHRQVPGDLIRVFDGQGREWTARLLGTEGKSVRFELLELHTSPPPFPLVGLGLALIKARALEWALEKSVELGVREIHLVRTVHSVVHWRDPEVSQKLARWQTVVIEAAKQCGQTWLPELFAPASIEGFLSRVPPNASKFLASLRSDAIPWKEAWAKVCHASPIFLMIGPEGDFTPEEEEQARAKGFVPVSLGPLTLRSETAALCLLSALRLFA